MIYMIMMVYDFIKIDEMEKNTFFLLYLQNNISFLSSSSFFSLLIREEEVKKMIKFKAPLQIQKELWE